MPKGSEDSRSHPSDGGWRKYFRPQKLATNVQIMQQRKDNNGGNEQDTPRGEKEDHSDRVEVIFHYWRPRRRMVVNWEGKREYVNHIECSVPCHTIYPKTESMPHVVMQCRGSVTIDINRNGTKTARID